MDCEGLRPLRGQNVTRDELHGRVTLAWAWDMAAVDWVAVEELKFSCCNKENLLFTIYPIYPYCGN